MLLESYKYSTVTSLIVVDDAICGTCIYKVKDDMSDRAVAICFISKPKMTEILAMSPDTKHQK